MNALPLARAVLKSIQTAPYEHLRDVRFLLSINNSSNDISSTEVPLCSASTRRVDTLAALALLRNQWGILGFSKGGENDSMSTSHRLAIGVSGSAASVESLSKLFWILKRFKAPASTPCIGDSSPPTENNTQCWGSQPQDPSTESAVVSWKYIHHDESCSVFPFCREFLAASPQATVGLFPPPGVPLAASRDLLKPMRFINEALPCEVTVSNEEVTLSTGISCEEALDGTESLSNSFSLRWELAPLSSPQDIGENSVVRRPRTVNSYFAVVECGEDSTLLTEYVGLLPLSNSIRFWKEIATGDWADGGAMHVLGLQEPEYECLEEHDEDCGDEEAVEEGWDNAYVRALEEVLHTVNPSSARATRLHLRTPLRSAKEQIERAKKEAFQDVLPSEYSKFILPLGKNEDHAFAIKGRLYYVFEEDGKEDSSIRFIDVPPLLIKRGNCAKQNAT